MPYEFFHLFRFCKAKNKNEFKLKTLNQIIFSMMIFMIGILWWGPTFPAADVLMLLSYRHTILHTVLTDVTIDDNITNIIVICCCSYWMKMWSFCWKPNRTKDNSTNSVRALLKWVLSFISIYLYPDVYTQKYIIA